MRALPLALVVVLVGCGRTELVRYSDEKPDASMDAGVDAGRPDAGRPDAGIDAGFDAGIDAGCEPRPLQLEPALPTVMFVIDRSGSMEEDLDGRPDAGPGLSRWEVLEQSLRSVLPPLDQRIAMGSLVYPVRGQSCTVPGMVDLSPALGNANRLVSLIALSSPLGGTPTSDALNVAATHLQTIRTATSARALILATDGAPNCNFALMPSTCVCTAPPVVNPNCDSPTHCLDDNRSIATLTNLFQNSRIPTYVIGLGSSLNQFAGTLDRMAVAGGVPRMGIGARYYSANNQAELTDAFSRVTSQLTRCTYLVTGLQPNDTLTLRVGGVEVPEGPTGWEWLDPMRGELVLNGMPCDSVAMGATATVLVECR